MHDDVQRQTMVSHFIYLYIYRSCLIISFGIFHAIVRWGKSSRDDI